MDTETHAGIPDHGWQPCRKDVVCCGHRDIHAGTAAAGRAATAMA
jgi:hypothetical protein